MKKMSSTASSNRALLRVQCNYQVAFGETQEAGDEVVRDEERDVLVDVHLLHVVVQVVLRADTPHSFEYSTVSPQ